MIAAYGRASPPFCKIEIIYLRSYERWAISRRLFCIEFIHPLRYHNFHAFVFIALVSIDIGDLAAEARRLFAGSSF